MNIRLHRCACRSTSLLFSCNKIFLFAKFQNFRENFNFANIVKRHICNVKNSLLGHDLPTLVHDRVILPFREGFIFTKLRICEVSRKIKLVKISEFTVLAIQESFCRCLIILYCLNLFNIFYFTALLHLLTKSFLLCLPEKSLYG